MKYFLIIFLYLAIFSTPSFVVTDPPPPVQITGKGVSTKYSSEDYDTPNNGKVIIQYWTTTFEGPEYFWIIKQAHVVITPPKGADIEDFDITFDEPAIACDLMDWKPKLNGKGVTLAFSVNIDKTPGINVGAEGTFGVDEVSVVDAPGSGDNPDEGFWNVDWDDFSDSAESKATLDFYAKWRCPKGNKDLRHVPYVDAGDCSMGIEFDVWGPDTIYWLEDGITTNESTWEEFQKEEEIGSAWTPSKGTTRVAVVGTVRNEEVMMTTRGGSINGTVTVETEDGEQLTTVVPDEKGHFAVDFGHIATGMRATKLIITALDSDGIPQTSSTVNYIPEIPSEIVEIPEVTAPEIPYLENHQLLELEGKNFGESSEVVITDSKGNDVLQETLSSSSRDIMYSMDAPVGQSEIRVKNEFGNSEPVEVSVYEFNVTAGKTNLVKNETTMIRANYEGLPIGTNIIFTNMAKNVTVKANGKAKKSGNDIIFKVKESVGQVSLNLKAKQAGGWAVNYTLEFPVSH